MAILLSSDNCIDDDFYLEDRTAEYLRYEKLDLAEFVKTTNFRTGQLGAFNTSIQLIENIVSGKKIILSAEDLAIANVLPCGYGKTLTYVCMAYEAKKRGLVDLVFIVTPSAMLRTSVCSQKKKDDIRKLSSILNEPLRSYSMERFSLPVGENGEHFIALTTQMLAFTDKNGSNADKFSEFLKKRFALTGKRSLIIIDECHCCSATDSNSRGNSWGQAVEKMTASGVAIAVLFTATPQREDGKSIPGFRCATLSTAAKKRSMTRALKDNPEKLELTEYTDLMSNVVLVPDYEFNKRRAVEEKSISDLQLHTVDVVMDLPQSDGTMKEKLISEMTLAETTGLIGKIVRDEKVITKVVERILSLLDQLRETQPGSQCIIFSGSDIGDKEDNAHAKDIQRIINKLDRSKKVIIATSKEADANQKILDFENGIGDIIITKQMGSVGMDIPSIRVVGFLSAIRTPVSTEQMIYRGGRIWSINGVQVCQGYIVSVGDVLFMRFWKAIIQGQGCGHMATHEKVIICTREIDKQEPTTTIPSEIKDAVLSGVFDSTTIDGLGSAESELAELYFAAWPKWRHRMNASEAAEQARGWDKNVLIQMGQAKIKTTNSVQFVPSVDINEEISDLKRKIQNTIVDIAKIFYNPRIDRNKFIAETKKWYPICVNQAGVIEKVKDIKSIKNLEAVLDAARKNYKREVDRVKQTRGADIKIEEFVVSDEFFDSED